MKLLLRYLGQHKGAILITLLLAAVSQTFTFISPFLLANKLIDPFANQVRYFQEHGLTDEYIRGIVTGILMIVACTAVSWISKVYMEYKLNVIIQKIGAQIYVDVQGHVLRLPYQDYEDQRSGTILSVLQKVRTDCQTFLVKFVSVIFVTSVGIVVVMIISFQLTPWLGLVYMGGAMVMIVVTRFLSNKLRLIQESIFNANTELSGTTTESFRNIEIVKSLGLIRQETGRLTEAILKILDKEIGKLKNVRLINYTQAGFVHTVHHIILFFMFMFILNGQLTVGQLVMMQLYFYLIFGALEELGYFIVAYREAETSFNNLHVILNKKVEVVPRSAEPIGKVERLRFCNVFFTHKDSVKQSLHDISFDIKNGETIAIVGPSGAGKTTLIKLLVGLYAPSQGSIFYNEHSHERINIEEFRHQLGLVTQDTQLFSGTIRDNLLFVDQTATDEMILNVLYKSDCGDLLARAGKGLDTLIGEGGLKTSGGERQRLSIARALLRNSSLLIFDEASSSLDAITEKGIANVIRQITQQGRYITIMIAHRLSTIMFADRIYVLERGGVTEVGSHYTLLKEKGLYYAMWRQQIGEENEAIAML